MRRRRRAQPRPQSSINVTPMGDVSLCLLLGFLVITPILLESLSASLPQAGGVGSARAKPDPVVVLTAEGRILFDGREVADEDLPDLLAEVFPADHTGDRKVVFQAAGEVPYQDVISLLDRLKALGVETFGIR